MLQGKIHVFIKQEVNVISRILGIITGSIFSHHVVMVMLDRHSGHVGNCNVILSFVYTRSVLC